MGLGSALSMLCLMMALGACAGGEPRASSSSAEVAAAVGMLESPDFRARRRAAEVLAEGEGPPAEAVPRLWRALGKEQNPEAYGAMLVALGASGIAEVRPLIDARLNDPDGDTQRFARTALKRWLVRNMLMSEDEELPPPPHRLYAPPGALPPGAPGAKAFPGLP